MPIDLDIFRAIWNSSTKVFFTLVFLGLAGLALTSEFPMAAAFFALVALALAAVAFQGAKREWIKLKVTKGKMT